jgi:drug/metabolite transporter (DMT)-like permease
VNPIIAVLLGRLVLNEPLGLRAVWAAAIILAGVIITTLPKRE